MIYAAVFFFLVSLVIAFGGYDGARDGLPGDRAIWVLGIVICLAIATLFYHHHFRLP